MLDKITRRTLRSTASKKGGLPFDGTGIKGLRSYLKAGGCTWPFSDCFVKLLCEKRFPKLDTHAGHAAKAKELFTLIFLYYRVGLPISEIARCRRVRTKRLQTEIFRLEKLAMHLIQIDGLTAQNGESFLPSHRKTSPTRDLVKNGTLVTQRISDLAFLLSIPDSSLLFQVMRVWAEIAESRQEIENVCKQDSELLLAAA